VYTLETDLTVFPSADDGWFPISGYLNSQNNMPPSAENSTLIN